MYRIQNFFFFGLLTFHKCTYQSTLRIPSKWLSDETMWPVRIVAIGFFGTPLSLRTFRTFFTFFVFSDLDFFLCRMMWDLKDPYKTMIIWVSNVIVWGKYLNLWCEFSSTALNLAHIVSCFMVVTNVHFHISLKIIPPS